LPWTLLCFFFYLLDDMRWTVSATISCHHNVLPQYRLRNIEWSDHGLNPLKLWTEINHSSLKLFMSGILLTVTK
jgi:hypothetical protein